MSRADARRPGVSVLTVTHGNRDEIAACLRSVPVEIGGRPVELRVLDSGSRDGTFEAIPELDGLTAVAVPDNVGFAAGMNQLVREARGQRVLLLNPDVVLDPGCLERLVEHLDRSDDRLAGVAATLRYPDGRPQEFARREPSVRDVFWGLTWLGKRLDRWRGGAAEAARTHRERFERGASVTEVDSPIAACVLLPAEILGDRPFDERFPLYFNDTDLYRRLRGAGYRFEVLAEATATHGYGTSTRRVPWDRMRAEYVRSLRRYAAKHWGTLRRALLDGLLVLDAVTAAVAWRLGRRTEEFAVRFRGTLGGLGLPGGSRPWMDG